MEDPGIPRHRQQNRQEKIPGAMAAEDSRRQRFVAAQRVRTGRDHRHHLLHHHWHRPGHSPGTGLAPDP